MKNENKTKSDAEILRQNAEELQRKEPSKEVLKLSEDETAKLIQELELHQIELEMQNHELTLAEETAIYAVNKYEDLYDFAPAGHFTLSKDGEIIELNLSGAQLLGKGRERLKNKHFSLYVSPETKPIFKTFLKRVYKDKIKVTSQISLSIDGNLPLQIHMSGMVSRNGEYCLISVVDISEIKHAEQLRTENEEKYRFMFANNPQPMWIFDLETLAFLEVNKAAVKHYGYSEDEFLSMTIKDVRPSEEIPALLKDLETVTTEVTNVGEWIHKKKNGDLIQVELVYQPIIFNGRKARHALIKDITEAKKTQKALLESENRLSILFKDSPDPYFLILSDIIIDCNRTTERMLGCDRAQIIGHSPDYFSPEFQPDGKKSSEAVAAHFKIAFQTGNNTFEWLHRRPDGTEFLVEVSIVSMMLEGKQTLFTTWRDITERNRVEELLEHERDLYLDLVNNLSAGVYRIRVFPDVQWENCIEENCEQSPYSVEVSNERFCEILGINKEVFEKQPTYIVTLVHSDDRSEFIDKNTDANEKLIPFIWEGRLVVDGKTKWVHFESLPRELANGDVLWTGILYDISESKQAEDLLKLTRQSYIDIIDTVSESIFVLDENGIFINANKGAEKMYQLTKVELIGQTPTFLSASGLNDHEKIERILHTVFETGIPACFDFWSIRKNGEVFPKEVIVNKGTYFDKNVLIATSRDITERKHAEETLRESEHLLRESQEVARLGSYAWDLVKGHWTSSEILDNIFGIDEDYVRSLEGWVNLIHPDWQKIMNDYITNNIIGGHQKFDKEYKIIKQDNGQEYWVHGLGQIELDNSGQVVKLIGTITNITERKRAEEALEYQSNLQHLLMEISSDFINLPLTNLEHLISISLQNIGLFVGADRSYIFDYDFDKQVSINTHEWCNEGIASQINNLKAVPLTDMIGWPETHCKGEAMYIQDVLSLDLGIVRSWLEPQGIKSLLAVPMMINEECIGFVGFDSVLHHQTYSETEQNLLKVFAQMLVNIQIRKRTEVALRDSETRLHTLVQTIPDLIWLKNTKGVYLTCNRMFERFFGANENQIIGKTDYDFVEKELADFFCEHDRIAMTSGKSTRNEETITFADDGHTAFLETLKTPMYDSTGKIIGVLGIGHDITERKRVEIALKESEDKYRTMIEYSNDLIWILDNNGKFTFLNEIALKTVDIDQKELVGMSFTPLILEEDLPMVLDVFQRTIHGEPCNYELRFKRKDEKILFISVNTSPIYVSGKVEGVASFGRDITEQKMAEDSLNETMEEMIRFHRLTVGRELTMIELKKEINELLKRNGETEKYNIVG